MGEWVRGLIKVVLITHAATTMERQNTIEYVVHRVGGWAGGGLDKRQWFYRVCSTLVGWVSEYGWLRGQIKDSPHYGKTKHYRVCI